MLVDTEPEIDEHSLGQSIAAHHRAPPYAQPVERAPNQANAAEIDVRAPAAISAEPSGPWAQGHAAKLGLHAVEVNVTPSDVPN